MQILTGGAVVLGTILVYKMIELAARNIVLSEENYHRNHDSAKVDCIVKIDNETTIEGLCFINKMADTFIECMCKNFNTSQEMKKGDWQNCTNGGGFERRSRRYYRGWAFTSNEINDLYKCASNVAAANFGNRVELDIRNKDEHAGGCSSSFLRKT